ncbi:MAG: hypothetical protein VX730_08560 [Pseudomonadota bacterium]|nr:hypothetical protein [Pseudomonadota bacterium]
MFWAFYLLFGAVTFISGNIYGNNMDLSSHNRASGLEMFLIWGAGIFVGCIGFWMTLFGWLTSKAFMQDVGTVLALPLFMLTLFMIGLAITEEKAATA